MNPDQLKTFIGSFWDDQILPSLTEYIRIPNKSPSFDPKWEENGYMEQAVTLMTDWARPHVAAFAGATMEVVRLPGRTLDLEVPTTNGEGGAAGAAELAQRDAWVAALRWAIAEAKARNG